MTFDWRSTDETEYRCVVVLDASYTNKGKLIGSVAHGLFGLAQNQFVKERAVTVQYPDRDEILQAVGSHYACLILSARSQAEMKAVVEKARKKAVPRCEVVEDMMFGTSAEQYEAVRAKPAHEHVFLSLSMFDRPKVLNGIAGNLPLYKGEINLAHNL